MADNKNQAQPDVNEQIKVRMDKLAALQEAGKDPFQITKYDVTHHTDEIRAIYEAHEKELLGDRPEVNTDGMDEQQAREAVNADYNERRAIMDASPIEVSFAGRMMFKRVMGKASFCNIADLKGRMQAYISRDAIGDDAYADFKKSDIGDIYGIKGFIFRTKTGEISVHAEEITLLSKSLQVLPEKFHGITDTDMRYRQRYVDLIMNPEVKDTFVKRSQIIKEIRRFLDGRDFMEVETPTLVSNAGGAAARPFETHYNALDEDVKLRISLELYLKRLIVGGLERVYEIGRVYRNEGVDTRHNPEFTLMELYQAYTDYEGMMELTESMFRHLAKTVCGTTEITYNGTKIDLGKPFRRLTMNDAIKEYAGVDFDTIKTDEEAKALAKERGIEFEERHTKGDIINLFFEEYCEEKLIQPTFIMDHPLAISPLTKKLGMENVLLYPVGRKVAEGVKKLGFKAEGDFQHMADKPSYQEAAALAEDLMRRFLHRDIDKVELLYNHFRSTAVQVLTRETYLPIDLTQEKKEEDKGRIPDYIVEPSVDVVMGELLPKVLRMKMFTVLLDSNASEHAARTMAMQIATDNANDLLQDLTVMYNKSRQQAITNELLDIVGGSMA